MSSYLGWHSRRACSFGRGSAGWSCSSSPAIPEQVTEHEWGTGEEIGTGGIVHNCWSKTGGAELERLAVQSWARDNNNATTC